MPRLLCVLLLLAGCTTPRTTLSTTSNMNLNGTWIKLTRSDCGRSYPAQLALNANDRYVARPDADAVQHPIWDVGSWTAAGGELRLSTANDAIIRYPFSLKNNVLTIKTPDGCTLDYQRK